MESKNLDLSVLSWQQKTAVGTFLAVGMGGFVWGSIYLTTDVSWKFFPLVIVGFVLLCFQFISKKE